MKDDLIDISIIIPIFNEKFEEIERCIKSVCEIKEFSYEIIIVDDGSKQELRNKYSALKKNNHVKLILKKKNEGVSSARNTGIKNANGQYVMFVDSDDVFHAEVLSGLGELKCDLYFFNARQYGENGKIRKSDEEKFIPRGEVNSRQILELFAGTYSFHSVVAKLIKRAFLIRNKILFDINMAIAEDSMFNYRVLSHNPSCYHINKHGYDYYYHDNHIIDRVSNNPYSRFKDNLMLFDVKYKIIENIKDEKIRTEIKENFFNRYVDSLFVFARILKRKNNMKALKRLSRDIMRYGEPTVSGKTFKLKLFIVKHHLWRVAVLSSFLSRTMKRLGNK